MLSAVLLSLGLAFVCVVPTVKAAGTTEMANLVIFVKMEGAEGNVFDEVTNNTTYTTDNWKTIKSMYDGGTIPNVNNSFSNYISTVTCGKVAVKNIFPQVYTRADNSEGIHVLELSQSQYGTDDAMVAEVIQKMQTATSDNNPDFLYVADNLDLNRDGCIDNLTIIVQGDTINGEDHSFKTDYGGSDTINGLLVRCYNAMPSKMLFNGQMRLISHEFLHTLGLPDLYRESGDGDTPGAGPVGIWDVMAAASSLAPQYPLGYLRARQGWLEGSQVAEITGSGTYTLTAVSQPDNAGGTRLYTIKTPLAQAESEIICLEYRKATESINYEHFVDEGLVMYRVDNKVPNLTNFNGKNYIYVYRPGVSEANDCKVSTVGAALNPKNGETSYGSTDLSADFSKDTLYYSDGSNSGISISDVKLSADGESITFNIEFAEYTDDWQPLGGVAASDASMSGTSLYADPDGNLYLAYITASEVNTAPQVRVLRWNQADGSWQQLGNSFPAKAGYDTSLVSCNGKLYLAYCGSDSLPYYSVWDGSAWSTATQIDTYAYPLSLQLITENGEIYVAYERYTNSYSLIIQSLPDKKVVADKGPTGGFSNPTVIKQGNLFYVAYAVSPNGSKIDSYNISTGKWENIYDYGTYGSVNLIHSQGTKLYGFSGNSGIPGVSEGEAYLSVWDGSAWTKIAVPQMTTFYQVSLVTAGDTVYLAYLNSANNSAGLLRLTENGFVSCYDGLNGYAIDFQAAVIGDQVYVATTTGTSITVRCQKVETGPAVTPPSQTSLTLSLTPPDGYTNPDVYIDGVQYTAAKNGNTYTLQLPDKTGKTAVMYYYNENNIPMGMYVWKLSYQGDNCTATPLPGLKDLLSYHGFSIRVIGYSGLRFKSGIDTQTRAQLLGNGVDGYRLTEYGTLYITASNLQQYPFIKGGQKVNGGRAYWTENGKVNDRVFETVSGRYRFTSVLTKLPKKAYATEIAFRSYAILQSANGEQIIIYGPPVTRSIYTVATQVLNQFKQGSDNYNYVKSIVDYVENSMGE